MWRSSATMAYLSMWATSSADGTQKLMSYSAGVQYARKFVGAEPKSESFEGQTDRTGKALS